MSARTQSFTSFACLAASLLGVTYVCSSAASPLESQRAQMAARTAAGPIKLDVLPASASAPIGSAVPVKVILRNANNLAVTSDH
jgi:hypothetical protein